MAQMAQYFDIQVGEQKDVIKPDRYHESEEFDFHFHQVTVWDRWGILVHTDDPIWFAATGPKAGAGVAFVPFCHGWSFLGAWLLPKFLPFKSSVL